MESLIFLEAFVELCANGQISYNSQAEFAQEIAVRLDRVALEWQALEFRVEDLQARLARTTGSGSGLTLVPPVQCSDQLPVAGN